MGLSGHRLGKQRLTRSGRAYQQRALGQLGADLGVLSGVMQEVHDLGQGLLGLVLSCHVLERDAGLLLHIHLGVALAHAHDSASAHAAHGEIHQEYQKQEGDGVVQHRGQNHAVVPGLHQDIHVVFQQTGGKIKIVVQPHHIVV